MDADGTLRVGDTRVLLEIVIHRYQQGEDALGIVDSYPTLTLAQAHGAIAYYLSHAAEVDAYMAERERKGDEMRRRINNEVSTDQLRERLRARSDELRNEDHGIPRG